jgi:hypothetical protein
MSQGSPHPDVLEIWRFVRGDTPAGDFEEWFYSNEDLEPKLGAALYLEVISADFSNRDAVHRLRQSLAAWAEKFERLECRCVRLADFAVVAMGDVQAVEVFATLEQQKRRGEPYWWLSTYECSACGQRWLVAQEERHNDVFILRRLAADEWEAILEQNAWPDNFDRYEDLLLRI